jgi:hypothetical protein
MLNVVAPHLGLGQNCFPVSKSWNRFETGHVIEHFSRKNEAAGLFCTRSPLQIQAEPTNSSHIKFISLSSFRENAHPSVYLKLPLNTR